jgi:hypothetical protein
VAIADLPSYANWEKTPVKLVYLVVRYLRGAISSDGAMQKDEDVLDACQGRLWRALAGKEVSGVDSG